MGEFHYQTGFRNFFETEAISGALPIGRNSPQKPAFGLYAEQLSGSSFTSARHENLRSWLYRILPSVKTGNFELLKQKYFLGTSDTATVPPDPFRWDPLPKPKDPCDLLDSLTTFAANGKNGLDGCGVHLYACNQSMKERFFYNADGEMLFVPQAGKLLFRTEFGNFELLPQEVGVIPRGIKFQVLLLDSQAQGYVCENYGIPLQLPQLGPIGSNGLAQPRDFQTPVAAFEEKKGSFELITKFNGKLYHTEITHSPLDVVAWHGNYAPYKYDLKRFNTIGSVSFDHPDPSIFTVLTSPSQTPGVANLDFVIFPERWMVANDTFRPPYYHRNLMSEFMGLIEGSYDAKPGKGFQPGGASLHNCMQAHGPDEQAFQKATEAKLKPEYYDNTLAFMFESRLIFELTEFALRTSTRQKDYLQCWSELSSHFSASEKG